MSDLKILVGKRIQSFRRNIGLTQDELAEKAGLSLKHLGEIERGRGNPTLSSLESLAGALKISVVQLFGFECEKLSPDQVKAEIDLIVHNSSEEERGKILRVLKVIGDQD